MKDALLLLPSPRLPLDQRIEDSIDWTVTQRITVDDPIPAHNVGYRLLMRLGWVGGALGRAGHGRTDPVPLLAGDNGIRAGLGRAEVDKQYTTVAARKALEVEIQADEDEVRQRRREAEAIRTQRIKEGVDEILKTFYCEASLHWWFPVLDAHETFAWKRKTTQNVLKGLVGDMRYHTFCYQISIPDLSQAVSDGDADGRAPLIVRPSPQKADGRNSSHDVCSRKKGPREEVQEAAGKGTRQTHFTVCVWIVGDVRPIYRYPHKPAAQFHLTSCCQVCVCL